MLQCCFKFLQRKHDNGIAKPKHLYSFTTQSRKALKRQILRTMLPCWERGFEFLQSKYNNGIGKPIQQKISFIFKPANFSTFPFNIASPVFIHMVGTFWKSCGSFEHFQQSWSISWTIVWQLQIVFTSPFSNIYNHLLHHQFGGMWCQLNSFSNLENLLSKKEKVQTTENSFNFLCRFLVTFIQNWHCPLNLNIQTFKNERSKLWFCLFMPDRHREY